jgi:hypothetical protein
MRMVSYSIMWSYTFVSLAKRGSHEITEVISILCIGTDCMSDYLPISGWKCCAWSIAKVSDGKALSNIHEILYPSLLP